MTTKTRPAPVSYEDGMAHLRNFATKKSAYYAAALLMEEDGQFYVWERTQEPCFGFLRTYKVTHPDCTRPQDHKPGDLINPFPPGNPAALAVPFQQNKDKNQQAFWDYWYGPDSPFHAVLIDAVLMDNEVQYTGIVFKDLNVDSTLLIQFLRQDRFIQRYVSNFFALREMFPEETDKLIGTVCRFVQSNGSSSGVQTDPKNYYNGKIVEDITGGTFYDRYAYNRPEVDYVFGHGNKLLNEYFRSRGFPYPPLEETLKFLKGIIGDDLSSTSNEEPTAPVLGKPKAQAAA